MNISLICGATIAVMNAIGLYLTVKLEHPVPFFISGVSSVLVSSGIYYWFS